MRISIAVVLAVVFLVGAGSYADDLKSRRKEVETIQKEWDTADAFLKDLNHSKPDLAWYVQAALKRNPNLKAAFFTWKASLEAVSIAFSLPDPQISYTNYLESVETRTGPQKNAYSVAQKIPLPDKLTLMKDKRFRASEAAYYRFIEKKLDLIYTITEVYYEYAYLAQAITLTEENINLLKQFEAVIQARYTAGIAKNQDLLKVQTEIEKLGNEILSLKDMRGVISARMNALLDLPEERILPWPSGAFATIEESQFDYEITSLVSRIKEHNPELLSLFEIIRKNEKEEKLARRAWFPDLTIQLTTIDTGDAINPDMADSGKDPFLVMFSFNVPLWFSKNNALIQSADSEIKSARNSYTNKELQLLAETQFIIYKLKDSLRQARLYNESLVPRAMQTLQVTKSAYEAGSVDFLSLIDAQRMLLQFQLSYYKYATSYYQFLAKLKKITGDEDAKSSNQ